MHNREGLTLRMIYDSLSDWGMWPLYVLGLVHMSMGVHRFNLNSSKHFIAFHSPCWATANIPHIVSQKFGVLNHRVKFAINTLNCHWHHDVVGDFLSR